MEESMKDACNRLRADAKKVETQTRALMEHSRFKDPENFKGQHSEVKASIMLAVRHLEDARMRLGKAIQYSTADGVSVFDK